MNAKRKGNRNERRSMALLEAAGYRCSRSAASLGAWDTVAIGPADIVLVQVKTNAWPGREEMELIKWSA
jgi:Holliday junction resolvase